MLAVRLSFTIFFLVMGKPKWVTSDECHKKDVNEAKSQRQKRKHELQHFLEEALDPDLKIDIGKRALIEGGRLFCF